MSLPFFEIDLFVECTAPSFPEPEALPEFPDSRPDSYPDPEVCDPSLVDRIGVSDSLEVVFLFGDSSADTLLSFRI